MNTKNKLPTKLHRALSSIKQYLDRMPQGVSLDTTIRKVGILSTLTQKELAQLLEHLAERESVHVYSVTPYSGAADKPEIRYLRMKRFGEPTAPEGFQLWPAADEALPATPRQRISEPAAPNFPPEDEIFVQKTAPDCIRPDTAKIFAKPVKKEAVTVATRTPSQAVAPIVKSAAQMRKEAEELLRQAEEAERASEQSDFFKKRLSPIKLELLQAANSIRTHLDGLIDGMAALEKAADKLKEITA